MKITLSMLVALLAVLSVSSQQPRPLPEFGKVDISELQLKECSFDKNAPAMYFFREAQSLAKIEGTALSSSLYEQMVVHVRMKIFNKEGLDYANVKIRYPINSDMVSIKKLSAQTYNLDDAGNIVVTKMDKS